MTGPPEQKEAPRSGDTLQGAKQTADRTATESMFPRAVKRRLCSWPIGLGATWLKDYRRSSP